MFGYSSTRTFMTPAIGIEMIAPMRPNMYMPIVMEMRMKRDGRFSEEPWIFGEMMLFSICW